MTGAVCWSPAQYVPIYFAGTNGYVGTVTDFWGKADAFSPPTRLYHRKRDLVSFVTIDPLQQDSAKGVAQGAGIQGYLAVPDAGGGQGVPDAGEGQEVPGGSGAGGPWPGVVLIPEVFGLDDNMTLHADRLARAGYLTLAVDIFGGQRGLRCVAAAVTALRRGQGPHFAVIEAARRWLLDRPDCTGQTGAIGFCVGGGFALLTASTGFDVTAVNYGNLPPHPDTAFDGACPVVANYGKRDMTLRGAAAKLEAALSRARVEHDVREFPGAGHAFMNEEESGPRALRPLLRVMGVGPVPEAAPEAWARIEDYFARYLR